MATLICTEKEFNRFIMPRIRNVVQTASRPLKTRAKGKCEHCGKQAELDAAHVHGKERKTLVNKAMAPYLEGNQYVIPDLQKLETEIMKAHEPIGQCFLFLCKDCHRKYDSKVYKPKQSVKNLAMQRAIQNRDTSKYSELPRRQRGGTMRIDLVPSDVQAFKAQLLKSRKANIIEFYTDGRIKEKSWDASKMRESSDIIGNLRSRPKYRGSAWVKEGLDHIEVIAK